MPHPSKPPLPQDLEAALAVLIGDCFSEDASLLHPETDLFAAGLDSMSTMHLIVAIEEKWGLTLPSEDLTSENFQTISRLAALLRLRSELAP